METLKYIYQRLKKHDLTENEKEELTRLPYHINLIEYYYDLSQDGLDRLYNEIMYIVKQSNYCNIILHYGYYDKVPNVTSIFYESYGDYAEKIIKIYDYLINNNNKVCVIFSTINPCDDNLIKYESYKTYLKNNFEYLQSYLPYIYKDNTYGTLGRECTVIYYKNYINNYKINKQYLKNIISSKKYKKSLENFNGNNNVKQIDEFKELKNEFKELKNEFKELKNKHIELENYCEVLESDNIKFQNEINELKINLQNYISHDSQKSQNNNNLDISEKINILDNKIDILLNNIYKL